MPAAPAYPIETAVAADAAAISALLNRSYRGASSRRGWTTEADLIGGEVRTDAAEVLDVLSRPSSVFLVHRDAEGVPEACVNLQAKAGRAYLGMFAVEPSRQNGGLGRAMLAAAEGWARSRGCRSVFMYVIGRRGELIEWYVRRGYADTGLRVPFPEDGRSGPHLLPLDFVVMEKGL